MLVEVGKSLLESFAVRLLDVLNWYSAVHLQALSCCYNDSELRLQSALATLDVEELLGSKVGTESCLSDDIFTECHSHLSGEYRVASVCNVGKRTAVYECCCILSGLNEVRSQSVAQKDGYGCSYTEILNGERLALNGVAQEDVLDATAQVVLVLCKTENSHNLRCRSDVKSRLAYNAIGFAAHTGYDVAQSAVVNVEHAVPQNLAQSETVVTVLVHVVVEQCSDSVVSRSDSVEVASEVQVNLVHRQHLGVATATRTALHSEYRTERRLTQSADSVLADVVQTESQTDSNGSLADTSLCRCNGCNEYEVAVLHTLLVDKACRNLSHIVAVVFKFFCRDAILRGYYLYLLELRAASYFDICHCM